MILYVYAIGRARHPLPERIEAIDGGDQIQSTEAGQLAAFHTPVDEADFSQPVIDARSKDVEWLGSIGYRHQNVMAALMRGGTVIPLRAFTLFAGEESLRRHMQSQREMFSRILERLDGKQEWTLRIEFNPERWSEALVRRMPELRALSEEMARSSSGRAFLLGRKLDDERKKASRDAEEQVVTEIEQAVMDKLACDTVAESRQQRSGGFPQINVLINRDEEARLEELRQDLEGRYADDGVTVALTGPWPPYSFARTMNEER